MAGDWIKMRGNLWDDPRVTRICDMTDQCEAAIIGALYWLWSTADQHSEDGFMHGLSLRGIDRKTGVQGFATALVEVGWLCEEQDGVQVPRFDEHNGASAKKRALTAKRVANFKAGNAVSVTEALAERDLEKEKEKELTTSSLRSEVERTHDDTQTGTQRKTSGPPTRAKQLPDDFQPDETAAGLAAGLGVTLSVELPKFRDYHVAKGTTMKDWQAALRTWIRNAKQFSSPKHPAGREESRRVAASTRLSDFRAACAAEHGVNDDRTIDAQPAARLLG